MEKNIYIEELRHERIQKTIEAVRDLEYSNPDKIKQIYMYKVITQDEYEREQREIKLEFRNRITDPAREVAKMEQKRNKMGGGRGKKSSI
jgi:hypothetical protein